MRMPNCSGCKSLKLKVWGNPGDCGVKTVEVNFSNWCTKAWGLCVHEKSDGVKVRR